MGIILFNHEISVCVSGADLFLGCLRLCVPSHESIYLLTGIKVHKNVVHTSLLAIWMCIVCLLQKTHAAVWIFYPRYYDQSCMSNDRTV